MKKQIFLTLAALAALPALAAEAKPENSLKDCLIQEVLPGKDMTAAFFTLEHKGAAQELTAAAIPDLSDNVQLHEMTMDGNVMKMQQIASYSVKDSENKFQKGGYHLMVMGVKDAPKLGSGHEITLTFKDGSTVSCQAKVASVEEVMKTAAAPAMDMHHEHHQHTEHKQDEHSSHEHKAQ